jgi:outer membrane protein assembly factor BamB
MRTTTILMAILAVLTYVSCRKENNEVPESCAGFALDSSKLQLLWQENNTGSAPYDINFSTNPIAFGENVLFTQGPAGHKMIHCRDGKTGALLWEAPAGAVTVESQYRVLYDQKLYYDDAVEIWEFDLNTRQSRVLLEYPGINIGRYLYAKGNLGVIHYQTEFTNDSIEEWAVLVDLQTGQKRRAYKANKDLKNSIEVLNTPKVYFVGADTMICVVEQSFAPGADGYQLIIHNLSKNETHRSILLRGFYSENSDNLLMDDERVYLLIDQRVYCFNVKTASLLWEFRGDWGGELDGLIYLTNDKLLLHHSYGGLTCLNILTGQPFWTNSPTQKATTNSGNFTHEGAYYFSTGLHFVAVDLETGCIVRKNLRPTSNYLRGGPALSPDGKRVYSMDNRSVFAFEL